jgi:5-methyltetrahydrofolate--homocysteine methyltransferase
MSWIKAMREKEPPEPNNPIGTVVIGNLQPDRMDTPKNMVRRSLKLAQFKTVDLGAAAHETSFATKAKEADADIIAVSINLSSAKEKLPNLISAIENEGIKGKVVVMIGGAAVEKEDADKIGALYGKTREEAVALAKRVIAEKHTNS